jgi:hypothetical protein
MSPGANEWLVLELEEILEVVPLPNLGLMPKKTRTVLLQLDRIVTLTGPLRMLEPRGTSGLRAIAIASFAFAEFAFAAFAFAAFAMPIPTREAEATAAAGSASPVCSTGLWPRTTAPEVVASPSDSVRTGCCDGSCSH